MQDNSKSLMTQSEIIFHWQDMQPVVSIVCKAYNHEEFIRDAIQGFLRQKTTFPFEIIIHDDASIDGTPDIIREYELKYPELLKPIYQKINEYSISNWRGLGICFEAACGKYIAICEGDDYWIDPLKLQKQFDALEMNPEYSLCVHDALILYANGHTKEFNVHIAHDSKIFGAHDIIRVSGQFAPSASYFFRKSVIGKIPQWKYQAPVIDFLIEIYSMKTGKGIYINECMSVYRFSEQNSWSSKFKNYHNYQFITDFGQRQLSVIQRIKGDFPEVEEEYFQQKESVLLKIMAHGNLLGKKFREFRGAIESSWNKAPHSSRGQRALFNLRFWPHLLRMLVIIKMQTDMYWVRLIKKAHIFKSSIR